MDNTKHKTDAVIHSIHIVMGVEKSEIIAESWLVQDLGVESLDFLEISYEIETRVGRPVDFRELFLPSPGEKYFKRDIRVQDILDYLMKD